MFFSWGGLGMTGKQLLGCGNGGRREHLKNLRTTLLGCKKIPVLNIKMYHILKRLGYLLFDLIQ